MRKYCLGLLIIIAGLAAGCGAPTPTNQSEIPAASVAIPAGYFYFYSTGCVHCSTVSTYVQTNNVKQHIFYVEKEVSGNVNNANLLRTIGSRCGINGDDLSVPLFWDGKNCYEGADKITAYFATKLNPGN